jgi:hypothetical protein
LLRWKIINPERGKRKMHGRRTHSRRFYQQIMKKIQQGKNARWEKRKATPTTKI